ncbi:MAG TPA: hypothetical protein VIC34_14620, partial [Croceibacterium sp.]
MVFKTGPMAIERRSSAFGARSAAHFSCGQIEMFFELETFAGTGVQGTQDGAAAVAMLDTPSWIASVPTGAVYVTETFSNGIRKIENGMVSTLTSRADGNADGPLSTALFRGPSGIVSDRMGNLYVGDQNNHRIRKIDVSGVVTT